MRQETLIKSIGLTPGQIVATVGGGGKTSILNAIARECREAGWSPVILTTTTHIFAPQPENKGNLLLGNSDSLKRTLFERSNRDWPDQLTLARTRVGMAPVPGNPDKMRMKLRGFEVGEISNFRIAGGVVLVEADGSRGLPIKAPGPDEPVLPPETNLVIGVVGLDSMGKPIDKFHVFRPERLVEVTGLSLGDPVDAETIGRLAAHPEGLFRRSPQSARRIVFLNKSDLIGAMAKLEQINYIVSELACGLGGPAEAVFLTSTTESEICRIRRMP